METNINSGQLEIKSLYGSVFLYTHDLAHTLLHVIHEVLSKKVKWDDPDYLARMFFCKMIPSEFWKTDLGFGIGTQMYADVQLLITIDTVNNKILITNFDKSNVITRSLHYSYESFLENFANNAEL